MRRQGFAVGAVLAVALSIQIGVAPPKVPATAVDPAPPTVPSWQLSRAENFSATLSVNKAAWVRDSQTASSRWAVDQFDDNGRVWHSISDPAITNQIGTINVYRKRVTFGTGGWLTAEIGLF